MKNEKRNVQNEKDCIKGKQDQKILMKLRTVLGRTKMNQSEYLQFNEIIKCLFNATHPLYEGKNVYHYTNLSSLLSIIENEELWLSERNCMNDVNDENFIKNFLTDFSNNPKNTYTTILSELINLATPHGHQYVFSTSIEEDSIHQWTYYGSSDAVCIVFDRQSLIDTFGEYCNWDKYYYGSMFYTKNFDKDSETKQVLYSVLSEYLRKLLFKQKELGNKESEEYKKVFEYCYSLIKQQEHSCEKEYRFSVIPETTNVKFRDRKGLIIPYIKIDIDPKKVISGIKIGPNNHEPMTETNLRFFLETNGLDNIPIDFSNMVIR